MGFLLGIQTTFHQNKYSIKDVLNWNFFLQIRKRLLSAVFDVTTEQSLLSIRWNRLKCKLSICFPVSIRESRPMCFYHFSITSEMKPNSKEFVIVGLHKKAQWMYYCKKCFSSQMSPSSQIFKQPLFLLLRQMSKHWSKCLKLCRNGVNTSWVCSPSRAGVRWGGGAIGARPFPGPVKSMNFRMFSGWAPPPGKKIKPPLHKFLTTPPSPSRTPT